MMEGSRCWPTAPRPAALRSGARPWCAATTTSMPTMSWSKLILVATEVVKQAAERVHQRGERESNLIRVKEVSASRGKAMRAEPISLLYEKGRVLHRHGLDQLEGEMMAFSREWDRAVDGSPNRLDAMIWGITRLSKIITQIPIA